VRVSATSQSSVSGMCARVALRPAAVVRVVNECVQLPVWTCREGGPAAVCGRVFVYLRVERIC
jgi:hypothetical protein